MTILLWVLGIHLIELLGIAIYMIIKKNNQLERVVERQQNYISAVQILINNSDRQLEELDRTGAFRSDDEIGWFFENIKQMQSILHDFKN